MLDIKLLSRVCKVPGAPGFENKIRETIIEEIKPYVDELTIDNLGSLIAVKKGLSSKKVMIAAHMDEIGFIVTHIDEDGFLRFHTLGGFDPKTLTSQRVIVHGKKDVIGVLGSKPVHMMKPEERTKLLPISEYYIDLGMSKEAVEEIIFIGAPITRERELIEMGDCVNSKSLDNRVSVYILIEVLKALKDVDVPYDIYGVFTVQEEVGLRGAISAAHLINPDFGFGLDVTIAFDVPGSNGHDKITCLGEGAAIKIMDGTSISDYRMVEYLKKTADEHSIKWQPEILTAGGTDTAGVQRYGKKGAISGAISIPVRNMHQTIEMAHKGDILNCIELLKVSVTNLGGQNWDF